MTDFVTHDGGHHITPDADYLCRCPGCGNVASYIGPEGCVDDWDGSTYRFKCCGHRAHLDPSKGGAETWIKKR